MTITETYGCFGQLPGELSPEINEAIDELAAEGKVVLDVRYSTLVMPDADDAGRIKEWHNALLLIGVA